MSKFLAFSLMTIMMIIGIIGGFYIAGQKNLTIAPQAESKLPIDTQKQQAIYSDQDFLRDMIAHHEDAVVMSKRVLTHTSRKEIRLLATGIIDTQTKEIEQMKQWLTDWQ